jgi:hypothetical protein
MSVASWVAPLAGSVRRSMRARPACSLRGDGGGVRAEALATLDALEQALKARGGDKAVLQTRLSRTSPAPTGIARRICRITSVRGRSACHRDSLISNSSSGQPKASATRITRFSASEDGSGA